MYSLERLEHNFVPLETFVVREAELSRGQVRSTSHLRTHFQCAALPEDLLVMNSLHVLRSIEKSKIDGWRDYASEFEDSRIANPQGHPT